MNLTTNYLGLPLKNPLVAGASPLSRELDVIRALEDAGIAAIVMYSLFEEQIEHELRAHHHFETFGADCFAEAVTYRPDLDYLPRTPDAYVEHVARVKQAVNIPVIPSLNGATAGGWIHYATMLEQAGADAIELNIYHLAADPFVDAAAVEELYVETLQAVKQAVKIPVAMKLSPYFTSLANFAQRLDRQGVNGLVLFNRFYQPDMDLEMRDVAPGVVLSAPHEMRLPLRWIAILDPIVDASLAATTGVYTHEDVIKLLMAGADATMLCAALLKNGVKAVTTMLNGLMYWMDEHEYESIEMMQGCMNQRACPDPGAFERANYMKALNSFV